MVHLRREQMPSKKVQSPANGKNLAKCLFDRFCTFGRVQNSLKRDMKKAPQVGLEPTTLRLTAGCSAIELLRSNGTAGSDFRQRDRKNLTERETAGQWLFPLTQYPPEPDLLDDGGTSSFSNNFKCADLGIQSRYCLRLWYRSSTERQDQSPVCFSAGARSLVEEVPADIGSLWGPMRVPGTISVDLRNEYRKC